MRRGSGSRSVCSSRVVGADGGGLGEGAEGSEVAMAQEAGEDEAGVDGAGAKMTTAGVCGW